MQIKYFETAWNDIKNSPGWFGKVCLLALIGLIPIFGQIVLYGYLYGWAREMAWGTHQPMPAKIFSNDDGKFWRRGWFLLVIAFVFQLVPTIVTSIGSSMQGSGVYSSMGAMSNGASALDAGAAASAGIGMLLYLIGLALSLLVGILVWIASMRTAIYDRLSAGFQLDKIWKMFRHDTSGVMRIFGMNLLLGLIMGVIFTVVITVAILIFVVAGMGTQAGVGNSDSATALILSMGGLFVVVMIAITYLAMVASTVIEALVARAMGYWTLQFDVPRWRGQDDPMPFELADMAYAANPYAAGAVQQPQVQPQAAPQAVPMADQWQPQAQVQPQPQAQVQPQAQPQPQVQAQAAPVAEQWQGEAQAQVEPAAALQQEQPPAESPVEPQQEQPPAAPADGKE